jgi:uncharacterized repeat protein (TIGR01451 family)
LLSATFLGGSASDAATAIALDPSGNLLLAGVTASADFPLAFALQAQPGGQRDAFLAKLRGDGSALLSSTYFGGGADDAARAVATDSRGNIFLAGDTASADFPLAAATQLQCAADSAGACSGDAFLAALNPAASQLHFASFLGGSGADSARALALDSSGAVYLAGSSSSPDLPAAQPVQPVHGGDADAFLAQFTDVVPISHGAAPDPAAPAITACTGTVQWIGPANGQWNTAANWSTGVIPISTDDVCIPPGANGPVVVGGLAAANQSINSLITNVELLVSSGPLTIANPSTFDANYTQSGGTLTLNSMATFTGTVSLSNGTLTLNGATGFNGAFNLSGGSLTGTGALTISGLFTWSGGSQDGGGATLANGGMLLNGGIRALRSRTLDTPTAVTWVAGRFDHGLGAMINNTSTWDLQSDDDFLFTQGGTRGTFNNNGTFTKSAGAGLSSLDVLFLNSAAGILNVNSGTLGLPFDTANSGAFNIASGALVDFSGGTHNWNAGSTLNGTGLVDVGATVNVNATIPVNLPLTQTGGTMTGAGTLDFNALFTWAGGTQDGGGITNINAGMVLNGGIHTLRSRTLNTPTPVTWTGGRFDHGLGAVINNSSTWDLQSDDDFVFTQGGTRGSFNNNGTFTKSAGAGLSTMDVSFNLPGSGTVNANSGTLQVNFDIVSSGAFNVAATLDFNIGTHNWNAGTVCNGAGTVLISTVVNVNATVAVANSLQLLSGATVAGTGTLNLNGPVTWAGGVFDGGGVTNVNAGMSLTNTTHFLRNRTLNTASPVTWTAGRFDHGLGGIINNTSTWDLQSDDDFLFTQGGARVTFNNNGGTFTKSAGTGLSTIDVILANAATGVIAANAGTLQFNADSTSDGDFNVAATLDFNNGTHNFNLGAAISGVGVTLISTPANFNAGSSITTSLTIASGAVVNFLTGAPVALSTLTQTGGTLTGTDTVNIAGLFTWGGGTHDGGGVTNANGGMLLNITTRTLRTRTLNTASPVTWTAGRFDHGLGSIINNSSTWDLQSDDDFLFTQGGTRGVFNNSGAFTKSAGTGLSTVDMTLLHAASGVINVLTGTLQLNFDSTNNGDYNVTGTLDLNSGAHNFEAGSTVTGSGTLVLGATVNFNAGSIASTTAPVLVNGGTTSFQTGVAVSMSSLTQTAGTLQGSDTINISGVFNWSGGTQNGPGTTNANGGFNLTGGANLNNGRTLNNAATGVISGGGFYNGGNGAVFNNLPGATLDLQNDLRLGSFLGGTDTINNQGTLTRSGAGNFTIFAIFNNTGTVNITAGTLTLSGGGASSSPINAAGTLAVTSGTFDFNSPASLSGAGLATFSATVNFNAGSSISTAVNLTGGILTLQTGSTVTFPNLTQTAGTLSGTGIVDVTGVFNWSGGTQEGAGTTNANGGFNLTGGVNLNNGRTLNNVASGVISAGGFYNGGNGAVFNNLPGATLDLQNDLRLGGFLGGTDTINNQGTLTRSTATGIFTIFAVFNNTGTVTVNTGTLVLANGGSCGSACDGDFNSVATLQFSNGTFDLGPAADVMGTGTVSVTGGTVNHAGVYNVSGGTRALGGTWNLTGTVSSVGAITITSGTLNLSKAAPPGPIITSSLTQSGGTLQGADTLDVTGVFNWSGGTQNGPGTTNANGGFNLTGGVNLNSGRTLNNAATGVISANGFYNGGNGAVFNNLPGATLDIQNDLRLGGFLGGTDTFNNQGTLTRSVATGTFTIFAAFNNTGAVTVNTGTLTLANDSTSTGSFTVTGTLHLSGGTHNFNAASTVTGSGSLILNTTVNFNAGSVASNTGPILLNGGVTTFQTGAAVTMSALTQTFGTLQGPDTIHITGVFNWSGGTQNGPGTTNANGGFNLTGGVNLNNGRILNNAAMGVISSGGLYSGGNGAVFNNLPGATLDIQSDLRLGGFLGGTDTFNNQGTLTRSTATGTFSIFAIFNNTGTVSVLTGRLTLSGSGTYTGSFNLTGTLRMDAGTHDFNAGSSLSGPGLAEIFTTVNFNAGSSLTTALSLQSGILTLQTGAPVAPASFTQTSGTLAGPDTLHLNTLFTWSGGTQDGSGVTNANAGFSLTGGVVMNNGRTLNNAASSTVSSFGFLSMGNGAVFNNLPGATLELRDNGRLGGFVGGTDTINNQGTLRCLAGASTFFISSSQFNNSGLIELLSGELEFSSGVPQFTQTAGVTRLNGGSLTAFATMTFAGGILEGVGPGAISATISNTGAVLSPGLSPAILNHSFGSYTQGAGGSFNVEIGGLTPGTQHDQYTVPSGSAVLGGTLNVTLTGGFTPAPGNTFTILTALSRSGTFAVSNLPALGGGLVWSVIYTANSVQLQVQNPIVCNINFDNSSGNNLWEDPANWDTNALPVATSRACIGSVFNVMLTSGAHTVDQFQSDGPLTLSGGSLTITGVSGGSLVNNTFTQSGGTLDGAGALNLIGLFTWSGGIQQGTGPTISNGGADITNLPVLRTRAMTFGANSTLHGSINHGQGAVINIPTGANFTLFGPGSSFNFTEGGAASTLNVAGTLSKVSSGVSALQMAVHNSGTIISSFARISFTSTYTQTGAASRLRLNGGDVQAAVPLAIQGGVVEGGNSPSSGSAIFGDVQNTGGLVAPGLSGGVGTLGITGSYIQGAGGTLEIEAFGVSGSQFDVLSITGAATLGGTLNVQSLFGFTPVSGNSFTPLTYASLTGDFAAANNLIAPGLNMLTSPGGSSYTLSFVAAGACTINFDNSNASGLWQDPLNWDTNNLPGPADDVCIGVAIPGPFTVSKSGAGGDSINSLTIANGQGMFSLSANLDLATDSAIGDGGLTQTGGALTGNGMLDINGSFFWSGGTQDGAGQTNANGNLIINGTALKVLGQRILTSNLAGSISGPGQLQIGNLFVNQAGFDFLDDSDFTLGVPGAQVTNFGSITKSAGTGNTSIQTVVQNFGTIAAQSGTLTVSGTPFLNSGGVIDVQTGNLTAMRLTQTAGATQVTGPGLLTFTNPFDLQGGLFHGTVNFTANGSVVNSGGVVHPGASPGSITLSGDYTQGAGGTLVTELAGTGASQFDVLNVGGMATLDGVLAVTSFGGFTPMTGDSFAIMTYSSVSGDFAFKSGLNISSPPLTATPQANSYLLQVGAAGTADLSLAKSDSPDPVNAGADLTYTLNITNNGPDPATNVVLTDTLPANVSVVSATATQGSCTPGATVTCSIGTINNAAVVTVTILLRAIAGAGPTLTNNASVSSSETDPVPGNNSASAQTTVGNAVFFGPASYLCQSDSPFFAGIMAGTVALENFEDGLFNQNGVTANFGTVFTPGGLTDSVDCDDGVVDGLGTSGRSFFSGSGTPGITFTFNSAILGGFPTQAGIVWTDGGGTITFAAFDATGASLGVVTGTHADGSNSGTTGEDRFYGISNPGGISSITILNSAGGIEIDHLQYGPVAAPTVNLTLTKADSPDPVNVGGTLTYTLTVTNNGSTPATVVTLTDPLPGSVAFNSANTTQGNCSQSSGTVTCNLGTLNPAASATVSITVIPGPAAAPSVTNTASVAAAEGDSNPADNSASATTTVGAVTVDLALTKADSPDPVTVATTLTYTLTVTNNGPSTATNVVLSDPLPASVSFVSATPSQGTCSFGGGTVTCPLGTLLNGAMATVTLDVTPSTAAVPSVTNTASVTSAEPDSNLANNSGSATTTVTGPTADISVTKTDVPDPVNVGVLLSYLLTVANAGPDPATAVVLTDALPASLTFQSSTPSQGTCSRAGNTVTCNLGTIASGSNATVTITVTPGPTAVPSVTNTASVTTTASDLVPGNNSASTSTTVNPVADLSVTKIDTPDPVGTNSTLTYTVTVSNAGPSPATGVVLTDTLPAGVTFVSASPVCGIVGLTVTCNLGTVASGGSSPVTIAVTSGGVTTLTNSASVAANEPDPNLANNSVSENTAVVTGPVISLSTMNLVFASQPVGTTSPPQAFSVTNSGNAAVSISSIVATGDFTQTNTCGASLAAGGTCFVAITFTPTGTGTLIGDVTISHAAPGSPHVVQLSGAGVLAPSISLTSLSVVFGTQLINTTSPSQSVTLTNTGSAVLNLTSIVAGGEFAQTNTCGASVAVGASCTITITFTPVATGIRTGAITITSNAPGSPPVITLTGVGASPNVSISTSLLVFAAQPVGTSSASQNVTLTNSGANPLAISSITITGDFAQTNNCGMSLPAASSCTITITFNPTQAGALSGVLTISDNGAGSPRVVGLSGTGVTAALGLSPASLTFNAQPVGTTSGAMTSTLSNTGGVAVSISSITATGDFAVTHNCPASLAIGANCTLNVTFSPTATGLLSGAVNIANSTPVTPLALNLLGTGVTSSPAVALSAIQLVFPQTIVGNTSAAQPVTLSNTGNATLTISSIAVTGDFTLSPAGSCGMTLNPAANCIINVTFAPSAAGTLGGSLTITSDAPGSPHAVSLSGSAVAPGPAANLSTMQVNFGGIAVGRSTAAQPVTFSNTGNSALTIVSIVASGDFAQTNTCGGMLAAGANCTISITFTPSVPGLRAGAVTITHNAPGSPHSISLSGSGTSFSMTAQAGSPTSITVSAGQAATFNLSLVPAGGFNEQITVSCAGAPPLSTCTASPNNFNLSASVALNVVVTTTAARASAPPAPVRGPWPAGEPQHAVLPATWTLLLFAAGLLLLFGWFLAGRRQPAHACASPLPRTAGRRRLLPATAALLLAAFFTSCAGGVPTPPPTAGGGTPAGAYPITVTATSSSGLTTSVNLSVTVQ